MIPPVFLGEGGGAGAEEALYYALDRGLGEGFFVYHQLAYVDDDAQEGNADFVVLHRELGLLVIECKGDGVRRAGGRGWVRRQAGGDVPLKESPFEQAQRHVKALVRLLEGRVGTVLPEHAGRLPMFHGHAVAFPKARRRDVNLPLDVPGPIVMDSSDLDDIGPRVDEAFTFWRGDRSRRAPFAPKEFKRFRKHVLHPEIHLVSSMAAQIDSERQALIRLSEGQLLVTKGLWVNRRLEVQGGAGTGKTVVALEAARTLAAGGEDVLILCFNKALAEHLRRVVEGWGPLPGEVRAAHFHALCLEAYEALDEKVSIPTVGRGASREAVAAFWDEGAPLKLLEALEDGRMPRWDAVVVDEGQDFASGWWTVVEDCLRDRAEGRLVVFHDPDQDIFGRGAQIPAFDTRFPLYLNFRNTRRIGEALNKLANSELIPHPGAPEGEAPGVHPQGSPGPTLRRLSDLVADLANKQGVAPDQITVLTPRSKRNSLLAGARELGGHPLATDPLHRTGAVLHTTIGKFKGLESDVVILCDVDPTEPRSDRRARYVAASRARHRLFVFAKGDWLAADAQERGQ